MLNPSRSPTDASSPSPWPSPPARDKPILSGSQIPLVFTAVNRPRRRQPMLEGFTWFKQSGYRWEGDGRVVYIDPWEPEGPPADLILITHAHADHFVPEDIERQRKYGTKLVAPRDIAGELRGDVTPVAPGDAVEVAGVRSR